MTHAPITRFQIPSSYISSFPLSLLFISCLSNIFSTIYSFLLGYLLLQDWPPNPTNIPPSLLLPPPPPLLLSMNSMSKAPSSEVAEESGWTTYFEDFFNGERSSISSGVAASSSLLSDAASLAATATNKLANVHEFSENKNGKRRLSFKNRKKDFATMVDDALEDTASSPLNSPKVLHENRSCKPKAEGIHLSEEKRSISGEREEGKELGFMERESDCTELKKRGLCLVPLSVVVNYFG